MAGPTQSTTKPQLANLSLQSTASGQIIPIVYGTGRVSGKLFWCVPYAPVPNPPQQVGKGGQSNESTGFTYSASIMLGLCEGPIQSLEIGWQGKGRLLCWSAFEGPPPFRMTIPGRAAQVLMGLESLSLGFRVNPATFSFLTTNFPANAVPYNGTAWIGSAQLNLPDNQTPQNAFAVRGFCAIYEHDYRVLGTADELGGFYIAYDAHPADCIIDLLTNKEYGLGWPSSRILVDVGAFQDDDGEFLEDFGAGLVSVSSFRNYCHAMGFYFSPVLDSSRTALEVLTEWLQATNSAAVWSQGQLKFLPFGDIRVTGNGFDYFPDQTAVYDLGLDDFMLTGDGPVTVTRTGLADTFNDCPVEFNDRTQDYNLTTLDDPDQSDVEAFGLRIDGVRSLHCITRIDHALAISRLLAQQSIWVRNCYTFTLPQHYVLLEPMDLVTLTEPGLGMVKTVVRIVDILENENGDLAITANEWPFGVGVHTAFGPQKGDGIAGNWNVDPGDANAPVAFIPTLQMTGENVELWLATAGGPNWGGANVWVSDDNSTFVPAGIAQRARYGVLTSVMSPTDTSFGVDLSVSDGLMESATSANGAADDLTEVYIGGEVVSYQTATLTGANKYTLTGTLRARQMTLAGPHSPLDPVIRLDANVFKHSIAYNRLGTTIYVKLASFNGYGFGQQDVSDVTSYAFNIPLSPNLLPVPENATITITSSPA